jgi:hypothetical protein
MPINIGAIEPIKLYIVFRLRLTGVHILDQNSLSYKGLINDKRSQWVSSIARATNLDRNWQFLYLTGEDRPRTRKVHQNKPTPDSSNTNNHKKASVISIPPRFEGQEIRFPKKPSPSQALSSQSNDISKGSLADSLQLKDAC